MNINNVVIAGRLTKDPELRYTPNGVATVTMTVAVNRQFKNQQTGEREADFINCVAWRGLAETIANYFKKGDEIGGTGRIQTRSYENQEGKRVYVTEIVLNDISFGQKAGQGSQNGGNSGNHNQSGPNTRSNQQKSANGQYGGQTRLDEDPFANGGQIDISDDDLPF